MTDFYSQNRCVCSTRSHGPLLCAFCLSFHFKIAGSEMCYFPSWSFMIVFGCSFVRLLSVPGVCTFVFGTFVFGTFVFGTFVFGTMYTRCTLYFV